MVVFLPNHQLWHAKWKLSVGICTTHCIPLFFMFGADLYAQSVTINKISASELSREVY